MTFSHLKTFVAVAELRHFARAASTCNVSQPAVSHQIAQLEHEVGAKLLNRTARRVSLTVAGEVMLEEARRILAAVDRARERMHGVTSGAVGRIRLGASATPGLYLVPRLLAIYRAEHPAFELRFEIGVLDDICARVARNDLDMAIIAGVPTTHELRARPLCRDELVAVQAPSTRAAAKALRRELDAWFHRHRLKPGRLMSFNGPDAVKRAVIAGLGIAIVSKMTVEEELTTRRLAQIDVRLPLPARDVHVVDHPQKHHGAACSAMLGLLAATFCRANDAPGSTRWASRDRR